MEVSVRLQVEGEEESKINCSNKASNSRMSCLFNRIYIYILPHTFVAVHSHHHI